MGTEQIACPTNAIREANAENIQDVAASNLQLGKKYHEEALEEAGKSFRWALIFAGIGISFILLALTCQLLRAPTTISTMSFVTGIVIKMLSALNFYLYRRASKQLSAFYTCVARTELLLLANSIYTQM